MMVVHSLLVKTRVLNLDALVFLEVTLCLELLKVYPVMVLFWLLQASFTARYCQALCYICNVLTVLVGDPRYYYSRKLVQYIRSFYQGLVSLVTV